MAWKGFPEGVTWKLPSEGSLRVGQAKGTRMNIADVGGGRGMCKGPEAGRYEMEQPTGTPT